MPNEIIIAQFASRILQNPEMPHLKTESAKQIPTSSFANMRHLYSQTRTWTPRFSLMRDMDTNGGGEEGIVEKQEMPRKVSLQIIVLSSNRYTSTGLSPSLSGNLFFTRLPRQSFPRYVPHFSPRKNPFSGARYVRRRGSSGALPPPCSSSTSLFLSPYALYPLRDS